MTRLLELARDEDLGIGGEPGDLTCKVTLGETPRAPRTPRRISGRCRPRRADRSIWWCARCILWGLNADCAEDTQTLETKIASRAELVVCGMATIPEAVKVFAPNVTVEVKTPDGTLVPKGA